MLAADEFAPQAINEEAFVVYQGHHGDAGASRADVILPGAAFTEKSVTFVNTEGRTQMTRSAVAPPGAAREDWMIVRAFSEVAGAPLPFDDVADVRLRMSMISPTLVSYDELDPCSFAVDGMTQLSKVSGASSSQPLSLPVRDFYMTDVISRASRTMAQCSQKFTHHVPEKPQEQLIAV